MHPLPFTGSLRDTRIPGHGKKKDREVFAARYVWERDAIFGPVCLVGNVLIALGMASGQCIPYRLFIFKATTFICFFVQYIVVQTPKTRAHTISIRN